MPFKHSFTGRSSAVHTADFIIINSKNQNSEHHEKISGCCINTVFIRNSKSGIIAHWYMILKDRNLQNLDDQIKWSIESRRVLYEKDQ